MATDCLFCKIAAGVIPAKTVYQDEEFFAFHDIAPQAPVHVLLIPRKHVPTLEDLTEEDSGLMGRLLLRARQIARDLDVAQTGYRVVVNCQEGAGQSVFHIHFHVMGGRRMNWPPG